MTEQTKAQRLADELELVSSEELQDKAAAELRRLDANEVALLEALDEFVMEFGECGLTEKARALINRIEAERNEK